MRKLVAIMAVLLVAKVAVAQIEVGDVVVGGSGCANGTDISVSERGWVQIEFDDYEVNVGGVSDPSMDLKSCAIAIPLTVPDVYQVAVANSWLSARLNLTEGVEARARVESFFAGSDGLVETRDYEGPTSRRTYISSRHSDDEKIWSTCGEDVIMRLNTRILARTGETISVAPSSLQVRSAIVAPVDFRRCD